MSSSGAGADTRQSWQGNDCQDFLKLKESRVRQVSQELVFQKFTKFGRALIPRGKLDNLAESLKLNPQYELFG